MIDSLKLCYKEAEKRLKRDQIVALQTDTVLGLAVLPHSTALSNLFQLKKRSPKKPFVLMIHHIEQMKPFLVVDPLAQDLIDHFWPGPLTLILPIKEPSSFTHHPLDAPKWLSTYRSYFPHLDSIGIRIPDHAQLLNFLSYLKQPLAVTSANLSGKKNLLKTEQLPAEWNQKVIYYPELAEDQEADNLASTILKITNNKISTFRQGKLTEQMIRQVIKNYSS